jgi:hypothetical protein
VQIASDASEEINQEPNIVKMIKIATFKCLRHTCTARVKHNAPCRKITFSQPEGGRKKGGPGLRWLDSVLKDLKTLEENAWWKKAWDRDLWSEIIKEDKAHKGLYCEREQNKDFRKEFLLYVTTVMYLRHHQRVQSVCETVHKRLMSLVNESLFHILLTQSSETVIILTRTLYIPTDLPVVEEGKIKRESQCLNKG